jgi:ABC-type nitrate/sulfonate/bicarbonate transport system ATPase subunit
MKASGFYESCRLEMQGELVALWQHAGFTTLLVMHDVASAGQLEADEAALELALRAFALDAGPHRWMDHVRASARPRRK